MKEVPEAAFKNAAVIFKRLSEEETAVILTHLINGSDWTVNLLQRTTGYTAYKVRITLGFLQMQNIIKTESIGNQIIYNINREMYERYCGAAARIL